MRRPRVSVPVLVYLVVAFAVAGCFALLLERQSQAAQQNRAVLLELGEQNAQITSLLERQASNDKSRQQLIDDAVSAIAAEQYRALVAHDRRTEELLRRNTAAVGRVAAVRQPPLPAIPRPTPNGPAAAAVAVGPATGLQPAAPCRTNGRSGKCRK